jgi:hypothetical protein
MVRPLLFLIGKIKILKFILQIFLYKFNLDTITYLKNIVFKFYFFKLFIFIFIECLNFLIQSFVTIQKFLSPKYWIKVVKDSPKW